MEYPCSTCGNSAELLCLCTQERVCKACTGPHISRNPTKVHTLLPIEAELTLNADQSSAVRKSHIDKQYKTLLKNEIQTIERLKQQNLSAIQAKADALIADLRRITESKIEDLVSDSEIAKVNGTTFAELIEREVSNVSDCLAFVFFNQVIHHDSDLDNLDYFKSSFDEAKCEEELSKFSDFKLTCPSEQLFELTRTSEEYEDWLDEVKRRKDEELSKYERVLRRFDNEYGAWGVSGAPYVEATKFTVNTDIWLTGLGLGNAYSPGDYAVVQDLEIRAGSSTRGGILYSHPETVTRTWDGSEEERYFKVQFTAPVKLLKNTDYTIRIQYDAGDKIQAAGGSICDSVEGVTFAFTNASCDGGDLDNNGNPATAGPTRDIYFALVQVTL